MKPLTWSLNFNEIKKWNPNVGLLLSNLNFTSIYIFFWYWGEDKYVHTPDLSYVRATLWTWAVLSLLFFWSHFSHYILWYIAFRGLRTSHYEDRIYDSFPLRENADQRKLLFWYIIGSVWSKLLSASKMFLLFLFSSNSLKCSWYYKTCNYCSAGKKLYHSIATCSGLLENAKFLCFIWKAEGVVSHMF